MKSTTLVAISLVLFALLLVLSSAFFLDHQARNNFKQTVQANIDGVTAREQKTILDNAATSTVVFSQILEVQMETTAVFTDLEGAQTAAVRTRAAQSSVLLTAEADNLLLDSEIVAINRTVDAQEAILDERQATVAAVSSTRDAYQDQKPNVKFIEPEEDIEITLGDSVDVIIVASHPVGITAISVTTSDGSAFLGGNVVEDRMVFLNGRWKPLAPGTYTLEAFATSANNVGSERPAPARIITVTEKPEILTEPTANGSQ